MLESYFPVLDEIVGDASVVVEFFVVGFHIDAAKILMLRGRMNHEDTGQFGVFDL